MGIREDLKNETGKWLLRIEGEIGWLKPSDKRGAESLKNIRAYIKDSRYFLERGDLIRAFEAVIWAWAICETARELRLLKARKPKGKV